MGNLKKSIQMGFYGLMENILTNRVLLSHISYIVFGFISAIGIVFNSMAPFGIAFMAVCNKKYTYSGFIGVILGYISPIGQEFSIRNIYAIMIILAIKFIANNIKKAQGLAFCMVTGIFGSVVSDFVGINIYNASLTVILMCLAKALITASMIYFFYKIIDSLTKKGVRATIRDERMWLAVVAGVILLSLYSFEIYNINIGRVLAVYLIMIAAYIYEASGGSIAGVLVGITITLNNPKLAVICGVYGVSGLISGMMCFGRKANVSLSFVVVNAVMVTITQLDSSLSMLYEVLIAGVFFIMIPQKILNRVGAKNQTPIMVRENKSFKKSFVMRMLLSSSVLKDIQNSVLEVSGRLRKIDTDGLTSIYTLVADKICIDCSLRRNCWENRYSETMKNFREMATMLKTQGCLLKEKLPENMIDSCCKIGEIVNQINIVYSDYVEKQRVNNKISQIREIVAEQFGSLSKVFEDFAKDIDRFHSVDDELEKQIVDYFSKIGIKVIGVGVVKDYFGKIKCQICIDNQSRQGFNIDKLSDFLANISDREFEKPTEIKLTDIIEINYIEKVVYKLEVGTSQIAYNGNKLCGDSYDYFVDGKGKAYMILSDGMGKGSKAAIDGTMATKLFGKLVKVGFSFDSALKIVNQGLLVKSAEETSSTMDVCVVDLVTGKCDFYKAGAAPSYMKQNKKVKIFESVSLPIGILSGAEFKTQNSYVTNGDVIVMASDGICGNNDRWVRDEIENYTGRSAKELSQILCDKAIKVKKGKAEDDLTIIVGILKRNQKFRLSIEQHQEKEKVQIK